MTDEVTQKSPQKKDEKKPAVQSGSIRGANKRSVSTSSTPKPPAPAAVSVQTARPSSRTSNGSKKSLGNAQVESAPESSVKKPSPETSRKPEQQRNKAQPTGARNPNHRKVQPSVSQGGRDTKPKEQSAASVSGPQGKESSDALSSLQRVIADLKTTPPANNPSNGFSAPAAQVHPPNLPFPQSGSTAFVGSGVDLKHRKTVSLGPGGLSGNFNSFSPHLGAMMEDAEDGNSFEEGEIQEHPRQHGHQPRTHSQSFVAPRFAALAAQQEHVDSVGPTGRPQLAPGFMFGTRKRGGPVGPPINEEDAGFQFPQQQTTYHPDGSEVHRKIDTGEITGIMAEQVSLCLIMIRVHFEFRSADCVTEPD